jgi:hypothetical protein
MTSQEIVRFYDQNVYQIRLHVAIQLMMVKDMTPNDALNEADEFVRRLMDEEAGSLQARFG